MLFPLIGCEPNRAAYTAKDGGGYFGVNGIYYYDFKSKNRKELVYLPGDFISDIDIIDSDNLIISAWNFGNTGDREIQIYNISKNKINFLVRGSNPTYLFEHIIYYDSESNLVISEFDGEVKKEKETVIDKNRSLFRYEVVPVTDKEFIYKKNDVFLKYNIQDKSETVLNGLNNCSFGNMLWIDSKNKILCAKVIDDDFTNDYVFIDLEGKEYEVISFGNTTVLAVTYIEELEIIVFQEMTGSLFSGETQNLLAYDLKNKTMTSIQDGMDALNFIFSDRK